ncbi:MAG: PepSY-associated TM helix domain-containing protein [Steroidobacteraceae bacterium]
MTSTAIASPRTFHLRPLLVVVHRWFGLAIAVFLFVAGLTGAVISWDHELDSALNPQLYHAQSAQHGQSAGSLDNGLALASHVEALRPQLQVTYVPLVAEAGETLQMSVAPRIDPATGKLFALDYNQVAVDPATGVIQGQREWGAVSLARENLLPFLYKLHYSMHIPDVGTFELGVFIMGIIGIVWTLDAFVALVISFPSLKSWRKSFAFRWNKGGFPLLFDLHRSSGVWLWPLLLVLALTSVSMNLNYEVVRPVVSMFSRLSPDPISLRTPVAAEKAVAPAVTREQVLALAQAEGVRRGWKTPAGAVYYSPEYAAYGVGFFAPGNEHGDGGLGNAWLYFDAANGASMGASVPGEGTAGDIYLQAQFPLHSGRIAGLAGRILVSALGLIVAMLSVTGVWIWVRKRWRARVGVRSGQATGEAYVPQERASRA